MTREELVFLMAQTGTRPSAPPKDKLWEANAALTALCAALGISDAALDALAKGEAVVVPKILTHEIRAAVWWAQYDWHNQQLPADDNCSPEGVTELARRKVEDPRQAVIDQTAWRAGLIASPYAARDAEGGA
jgi:hypothetical protein